MPGEWERLWSALALLPINGATSAVLLLQLGQAGSISARPIRKMAGFIIFAIAIIPKRDSEKVYCFPSVFLTVCRTVPLLPNLTDNEEA